MLKNIRKREDLTGMKACQVFVTEKYSYNQMEVDRNAGRHVAVADGENE